MEQNRWKSKVLWASVAAQVIVVLKLTGTLDQMGLDAGYIDEVITAVLGLLATIGIINDPTNSERL